jgi:hypothetical protein
MGFFYYKKSDTTHLSFLRLSINAVPNLLKKSYRVEKVSSFGHFFNKASIWGFVDYVPKRPYFFNTVRLFQQN